MSGMGGQVPARAGENAAELRGQLVELLRRYGLQIPTARTWVDDFAEAVRAEERERIARELRAEATRYRTRASRTPRSNTLKAAALALDDFAAARLVRDSSDGES